MDADDLAQLVADRLSRIAPPGFHVRDTGGTIWFSAEPGRFPGQQSTYCGGGSFGIVIREMLDGGTMTRDWIASAAEQALSSLQDLVDEETHEPWPGLTRPPRPHADLRDSQLRMWFAEGPEIILECEPIPIPDLDGTS